MLQQVNNYLNNKKQHKIEFFYLTGGKIKKFTYPSHLCITSNGQLCISFAGSNQLILCAIDGKVLVSLFFMFVYDKNISFFQ
jgi:hypothetical protein